MPVRTHVARRMRNNDMAFSKAVKEGALLACGRCCCVCHKFCGTKIEVHHIREASEGGDNTYENAIPLCFDCHADMRSYDHRHPKGNKYSESELRHHRDRWYGKVKDSGGLVGHNTAVETDKRVYDRLLKILPWNGSISFIRVNNFAGFSFETARLDDLHAFTSHCTDPAFEFIDSDLEALRASLLGLIDEFTLTIARETFPTSTLGWNSVPGQWESEQADRFRKAVAKLHGTATKIVEVYGALIKTARRKLGVLPPPMPQEES